MKKFYILLGCVLAGAVIGAGRSGESAEERSNVIVINPIEVPAGREAEALRIWDRYAEYFRAQPGYVGTRLHEALGTDAKFHYINVAEWKSVESFMSALQSDELKKLGEGFPPEMPHYPSLYRVVRK